MTTLYTGSPAIAAPLVPTRPRASNAKHDRPVTYEVVHWIRGCIRLRIPRLARDAKFAQRLGQELVGLSQPQKGARDAASSSLVVLYQPIQSAPAGMADADPATRRSCRRFSNASA